MPDKERVLDPPAARAYYDRFGRKQDSQGFYEDPALEELIAHARFGDARRVFEFGCGTGKFAARLLDEQLPVSSYYLGVDISPIMVELTQGRLAPYGERTRVELSDGAVRFPLADRSVDRVVATYVLDLLPQADIRRFFSEAHRVLSPGGYACLAGLTRGVTLPSRLVTSLWTGAFRLHPALVGGCRPVRLSAFVAPEQWRLIHRHVVTPFAVPSEVLVLEATSTRE